MTSTEKRIGKWYFGGLSAAGATCFTHPLDLLKVHLQTHKGTNISVLTVAKSVIKHKGVRGLYNGISASLLRQLTYSTARFGIYETAKRTFTPKDGSKIPFLTSVLLAGLGGLAGGLVGTPADLVNVRMQNDIKLPLEKRRNYKHVIDGIYRVASKEGVLRLWTGGVTNCFRSALMTIGQVSFYEQAKAELLFTSYFQDNLTTHVTSSLIAGIAATTLCQPADVLKTRVMNAKPGEIKSMVSLIVNTFKEGPTAFFKGYIPAFVRIAPHTILTFVFLEQLNVNFGTIKKEA